MAANQQWMLYGAYGFTGGMILDDALRRGHRPSIAGRDRNRLQELARTHDLPYRVVSLDDKQALCAALGEVDLVLNAAGPFSETGARLIAACLDVGTAYADISGEFHHIRTLARHDAAAKKAGIAILTGAGFGVTFGECLAHYALSRVQDAVRLRVSVAADNAQTTATVRRTVVEVLAKGGYAVELGKLRRRPLAHTHWTFKDRGESRSFAAAPLGELAALYRSTNIHDIVVGRQLSAGKARILRLLSPWLRLALSIPALRKRAGRIGSKPQTAQSPGNPAEFRSRIWVEAWDRLGRSHLFYLETGEGYAETAKATLVNVEKMLSHDGLAGSFTPASAFGYALLDQLDDVQISGK
ncbi:saccharopine dehydrogenase family protein [Beijerinckia mobilis]|uniref:saccharopine dehydrogenase family protein n=1 Tax=Beijerinckia mobilis TaxID=231434 RepID=UPI0005573B20|nr:saccharopine dehydrogenase NADP-binding domain-containing protein [Beijerinckia mobilis]